MQDLLIDTNYDLIVLNGDLSFGESTRQEIDLICATNKRDWGQDPSIGLGFVNYINAPDTGNSRDLQVELRKQLGADGLTNIQITVQNGVLNAGSTRNG